MDSKRRTVQSSEQNEFIKTLQKMAYEYKRKIKGVRKCDTM